MTETAYHLRIAAPEDIAQIKKNLRRTMSNPEGRAQRKRYNDAIDRREMLVFVHSDPAQEEEVIEAFLEWHMKVDGTATIRDAGHGRWRATGRPRPAIDQRDAQNF